MPEGDTVYRVARRLRADLIGERPERVGLRDRGELRVLAGVPVRGVATRGKHLLIGFAAEREPVLHLHLGMYGRVFREEREAAAARPARITCWIETARRRWLFERMHTAELLPAGRLADHPALARLGPDLLAPEIDLAEVVARARRRAPHTASDMLLDQSIACGFGNIWRNEALFLARIHPATPFAALSDDEIERAYRLGREALAESAREGRPRLLAYGRAGEPCARCGERMRASRAGDDSRRAIWCPRCQPRPALTARRTG
jgi:endonuclease-8